MRLVLALLLGLCPPFSRVRATSARPQIAEPPTASDDDLRGRQAAVWDTCGYADGETLTCASGTCGMLVVFGRETAHLGCCGPDSCAMPTRCIETGSATETMVLECTDGQSSACATYTWPSYSAQSYFGTDTRTTVTVTETESSTTVQPTTIPTSGGGGNSDTDEPGLGTESGLTRRYQIGAGVETGVFGLFLLAFFRIFGCLMAPRRPSSGHGAPQTTADNINTPVKEPEFEDTQFLQTPRSDYPRQRCYVRPQDGQKQQYVPEKQGYQAQHYPPQSQYVLYVPQK